MKYIWISHVLDENTPAYAGGKGFIVIKEKDIMCGDSCNTANLQLSNHIGSHVDAPKHFVKDGKCVDEYEAGDWVFTKPLLIDIEAEPAEIIDVERVENALDSKTTDADLVLIRTGFEKYRHDEIYWKSPPGYSDKLSQYFENKFPSFSAIGIDTISISSFSHRDLGRVAHQAFLSAGIRIFEDLALSNISADMLISQVLMAPLSYKNSDGAPVSAFCIIE